MIDYKTLENNRSSWMKEESLVEKQNRLGLKGMTDKELMKLVLRNKASLFADAVAEDTLAVLDEHSDNLFSDLCLCGLDNQTALVVASMVELMRRRTIQKGKSVTTPNDVFQLVKHLAEEQERLIVVALNAAHEAIFTRTVTQGLVNQTIVHPREVFSDALKSRACAIAIAHNHPSGHLEPSEEDKLSTARLINAGAILGIKVIDHIVFSEEGFFSFLEHGLI